MLNAVKKIYFAFADNSLKVNVERIKHICEPQLLRLTFKIKEDI
jgi:hypothetical protein